MFTLWAGGLSGELIERKKEQTDAVQGENELMKG